MLPETLIQGESGRGRDQGRFWRNDSTNQVGSVRVVNGGNKEGVAIQSELHLLRSDVHMESVVSGEMKAPEVPGKYVSSWRLSDGNGNLFGQSVWVE